MAVYIGKTKYCAIKKSNLNNTDILITNNGNYTADEPYTGFNLVRVEVPEKILDELTVTPTIESQTIEPLHDGFSRVLVNPVTSTIDTNIKPENIKNGVTILGITGTLSFSTETLNVTPSTSLQTFNPTKDGYSQVTVQPVTASIDADIQPGNIIKGINILGVVGTAIRSNETTRNINENGTYRPDSPYTGFSEVVVNVKAKKQPLQITPKTTSQTFSTNDEYTGYDPVTVEAVTASIDSDIIATNIRKGINILGVVGTLVESKTQELQVTANGTYTPSQGYTGFSKVSVNINTVNNTTLTVTPKTTLQTFTPSQPYTGYGKVTINAVTAAIDSNIKAQNIIEGITILGVTGTATTAKVQSTKTLTVGSSTSTITTITPDTGFDGIASVKVDLTWIENQLKALNAGDTATTFVGQEKTVNITDITNTLQVTPDSGYDGLTKVTINLTSIQQQFNELKGQVVNVEADTILDGSITSLVSDVIEIRDYACYNCDGLAKVVLNNAQKIGQNAFANTNLSSLTISINSVCTLSSTNAFQGTPLASGTGNIYVPSALVNNYKTAPNWSTFAARITSI